MSNDLISRKELFNKVAEWSSRLDCENSKQFTLAEFEQIIAFEPTAYDVDKVIEELEQSKEEHEDECGFDEFEYIDYDSAIDIVKEGGV